MNLMIVESPTKAKKIAEYLGEGWQVIATAGHIRDLPKKSLGIDIANGFLPTYEVYEEKLKLVARLKTAALNASEIYLASDPDREGEAIAYHTMAALKLRGAKRITFSEISKKAILTAVKNHRKVDMNVVAAQEARRALDRLFGYIVSSIICNQSSLKLSAGRVQSPALKIIDMRDNEIKNFVKTNYYELFYKFHGLQLTCVNTSFSTSDDRVTDKKIYETIISNTKNMIINKHTDEKKNIKPKPCFTTSTLQQAASSVFSMQPKQAMDAAQKLFENAFITYHRTDSPNISAERHALIVEYLTSQGKPVRSEQQRYAASDANAQEAHEAICPTDLSRAEIGKEFDINTQNLYKLIYERTLLSAMPNGIDETCKLIAQSDYLIENKPVQFSVSETVTVEAGWRKYRIIEKPKKDSEQASLPADFENSVNVSTDDFSIAAKATKPPPRYTPADMVKVLEKLGIGRPSTYATIFESLVERQYIKVNEKFIEINDLGKRVVESLSTQQFLNLNYTKNMELELDAIANGKATYLSVVSAAYKILDAEKENIQFKVE